MIVLALLWLATQPPRPDTIRVRYCPNATRSAAVVRAFERAHPAPGPRQFYQANHVVPRCACGRDVVGNLAWQQIDSAAASDAVEKRVCADLRTAARWQGASIP